MPDLHDLLARVKACKGWSDLRVDQAECRSIDYDLFELIGGCKQESDGTLALYRAPAYTASLDAAVALVERELPGWSWQIRRSGFDSPVQAELWNPMDQPSQMRNERVDLNHGHAPLALLAALLAAKISQQSAALAARETEKHDE